MRNGHLFLEDMFMTDLFGRHVTKEQLKLVLMQPPLFRGHSELTITNLSGTGRWNYLDLDKLMHRKLSLVCLGFTSMNVPPMLRCPGPRAFRHFQMSGVAFGGHVPWVLCSVYLDLGAVVKEQVSAATLGSYIRGVVIPLVKLPCGCSFTREIDLSVRSYIWVTGGKMSKIKRVAWRCQW